VTAITEVDVLPFTFDVNDLSVVVDPETGATQMGYAKGEKRSVMRYAVAIRTDDGLEGRYVTHWGGSQSSLGQTIMLAPRLLGRNPEHREAIYDDLKREARAYDHMGHGPLDIALWDLVGRMYGASIASLLGGYRERLPAYASTHHGQKAPGGFDSIEAYADFCVACREMGLPAFKIHGWHDGDRKREARLVEAVRTAAGCDMDVMVDLSCKLRTYLDALYVGRACDDNACLWYEDPFRDSGVSVIGNRMLRENLKTPLMVSKHVRGPEQKAAFALAGGCDIINTDPEYDLGITGVMKIAHFAESIGMDLQVHGCGPAHRACISAIRNTHYYELTLVGPGMPNLIPPVYGCGYSDQLEGVAPDGSVAVPSAPGLGVEYDWQYIEANAIARQHFRWSD
jgi:L-alanine-DL-glutamate epimerase-like enolase superfamily enzyme